MSSPCYPQWCFVVVCTTVVSVDMLRGLSTIEATACHYRHLVVNVWCVCVCARVCVCVCVCVCVWVYVWAGCVSVVSPIDSSLYGVQ